MNFLIVGPGSMGCLFAARLSKAGHDVTLLDYNKERAHKITQQGIQVEGITGNYSVHVPVNTGAINTPPDAVLICVKANKTRDAGISVRNLLKSEATIITLQNGIGNVEILREIFGENTVQGGVTAEGATLLDWGKIRHAGQGDTVLGPERKSDNRLKKLIETFRNAGFEAKQSNNVDSLLWGKLIINVGINALTAITRLKNGRLPDIDGTRLIMEEVVNEAAAVAQAKEIELPYPDPLARVKEVCRLTAGNIASMLQDVLNERTTEIDFINGAITREGKALGIPTPINETITSLVHAIQETYHERL